MRVSEKLRLYLLNADKLKQYVCICTDMFSKCYGGDFENMSFSEIYLQRMHLNMGRFTFHERFVITQKFYESTCHFHLFRETSEIVDF